MLTPKEVVEGLKPCTYKYNEIKSLGDKINFGFLAQDILDAFGDKYNFVTKDEQNEFYQVNYYQFIAPLVSVVQQQQKEINLLKEEISKLRMEL